MDEANPHVNMMDNLTMKYVNQGTGPDPVMLDQDQTWNLIKVIASLVHGETNRNDVIKPEQTKWEGFTLTPQDFESRLVGAGINNWFR